MNSVFPKVWNGSFPPSKVSVRPISEPGKSYLDSALLLGNLCEPALLYFLGFVHPWWHTHPLPCWSPVSTIKRRAQHQASEQPVAGPGPAGPPAAMRAPCPLSALSCCWLLRPAAARPAGRDTAHRRCICVRISPDVREPQVEAWLSTHKFASQECFHLGFSHANEMMRKCRRCQGSAAGASINPQAVFRCEQPVGALTHISDLSGDRRSGSPCSWDNLPTDTSA